MTHSHAFRLPLPGASAEVRCAACPIRHRAICASCDAAEIARLEALKHYRTYEAGQTIAWAGDRLDYVASVVRGVATLSQTLPDGRRQMVGLLLPSDFIGRPGRRATPFDVTAASDTTLCCFRLAPFEDLLATTPHLSRRLVDMSLDELDAARTWMVLLGRKTAREKVASLLALLARRALADAPGPPRSRLAFDLPLTREAMADYLGLTLETVSRQMTALRADGVIALGPARRVAVRSLPALLAEIGDGARPGDGPAWPCPPG